MAKQYTAGMKRIGSQPFKEQVQLQPVKMSLDKGFYKHMNPKTAGKKVKICGG
jgi:hypothetical protein